MSNPSARAVSALTATSRLEAFATTRKTSSSVRYTTRSSRIPPSSASSSEYLARPIGIAPKDPASAWSRKATASVPVTPISAMCDRSKTPAASRTAWCSARSDE
jgi:hypothetical protein